MYIERVQLMKNGGKNKSVAFIILVSMSDNLNNIFSITLKLR